MTACLSCAGAMPCHRCGSFASQSTRYHWPVGHINLQYPSHARRTDATRSMIPLNKRTLHVASNHCVRCHRLHSICQKRLSTSTMPHSRAAPGGSAGCRHNQGMKAAPCVSLQRRRRVRRRVATSLRCLAAAAQFIRATHSSPGGCHRAGASLRFAKLLLESKCVWPSLGGAQLAAHRMHVSMRPECRIVCSISWVDVEHGGSCAAPVYRGRGCRVVVVGGTSRTGTPGPALRPASGCNPDASLVKTPVNSIELHMPSPQGPPASCAEPPKHHTTVTPGCAQAVCLLVH